MDEIKESLQEEAKRAAELIDECLTINRIHLNAGILACASLAAEGCASLEPANQFYDLLDAMKSGFESARKEMGK